jgi:hypothetical protein
LVHEAISRRYGPGAFGADMRLTIVFGSSPEFVVRKLPI